jgi:hypothetical protein
MSFLDEVVARLEAQGVGSFGTTIFKGSKAIIPTGVGPYLLISETGGLAPSPTQNNTATERPTAQLLSRAATMPAAMTQLKAAYDALGGANGLHNIVLSGTFYLYLRPRQSLTDMGTESGTGRVQIVFNIEAEKQPS